MKLSRKSELGSRGKDKVKTVYACTRTPGIRGAPFPRNVCSKLMFEQCTGKGMLTPDQADFRMDCPSSAAKLTISSSNGGKRYHGKQEATSFGFLKTGLREHNRIPFLLFHEETLFI